MITKITDEQSKQLDIIRDECIRMGLATGPTDKRKTRAAIKKAYADAGLVCPQKFYWLGSPNAGAEKAAELMSLTKPTTKQDALSHACYGSHDADWRASVLAWQAIGVEIDKTGLAETVPLCGWWWPLDDAVVVTDRPSELYLDDQGRLHGEGRLAIKYPDGWGFAAWHGVIIPPEWVLDTASVDPSLAITWENVEQRRCLIEIMGWTRIMGLLKTTSIERDADPRIGELLEADVPNVGRMRFLRAVCGTGRVFVLSVPPEMRTAREANAWTYDIHPDDLKIEVRT